MFIVTNYSLLRSEGPSAAIPNATMEFAALCLKNALLLLPPEKKGDEKSRKDSQEEQEECSEQPALETQVPAPPGSPLDPNELANLR